MGRACTSSGLRHMLIVLMLAVFEVVSVGGRRNFFPRHLAGNGVDGVGARRGICAKVVEKHGYKCQEFDVKTDDGYILSVQRIPEGKVGNNAGNKPPVLLQHGILADGVTWFMNSPQQGLGFILADNGFDVWISNLRGTRYSRRHVSLDPNFNQKFWDWTWDELADHDLAAILGFVQQQTGQKIHYVGHSLGTLMALATFAQGKQMDKVKSAALLSPIAYLSHVSPFAAVASRTFLGELGQAFGGAEFDPLGVGAHQLVQFVCSQPLVNCVDFLPVMTGVNCCLNRTTITEFTEHEPQPTSTKNLVHLSQIMRDGILRRYNYILPNINMAHYKSPNPPVYNLANIPPQLPLFMSYGGQDILSNNADVKRLLAEIKSHDPAKLQVQYVPDYGHLDFVLATNANNIVYNQVISFFRKFN